jgi:hypothetical protein
MSEFGGFVVGTVVGFGLAICLVAVGLPSEPPTQIEVRPAALEQAQKFCDYDGVKTLSPAGEYTIVECGDERTTLITGGLK